MTYRNYWNSNHRWTYIWIAITCFCSPQKVYELAHGLREAHNKERKVMHKLKVHGVIRSLSDGEHQHRHHHHHHSK